MNYAYDKKNITKICTQFVSTDTDLDTMISLSSS